MAKLQRLTVSVLRSDASLILQPGVLRQRAPAKSRRPRPAHLSLRSPKSRQREIDSNRKAAGSTLIVARACRQLDVRACAPASIGMTVSSPLLNWLCVLWLVAIALLMDGLSRRATAVGTPRGLRIGNAQRFGHHGQGDTEEEAAESRGRHQEPGSPHDIPLRINAYRG